MRSVRTARPCEPMRILRTARLFCVRQASEGTRTESRQASNGPRSANRSTAPEATRANDARTATSGQPLVPRQREELDEIVREGDLVEQCPCVGELHLREPVAVAVA